MTEEQPSLFDGEQLKAEGMAQALSRDDIPTWRDKFEGAVWALDPGTRFASEDIVRVVGLPGPSVPNKNNAVGALMSAMARRGWIAKEGHRVSIRRVSHARELRVWRRL